MIEERLTDPIAEVARLLPCAIRWLFAPPAEPTTLGSLPPPQMRALWMLRRRGDLTMRQVAGGLGVAMSTATQLADRLEQLGLVGRRPDAADRRVVRLALTESGRAAIAEQALVRNQRIAAAMEQLSPGERELVLEGLRLLERSARGTATEPAGGGRHLVWEMISAAMPPPAAAQDWGE